MGSQLCTILPSRQIEFKELNLVVKYNTSEMKTAKSQDQAILITGRSQIYSTGPKKTLIYDGQMKNSKFDGFGKLYNDNEVVYEGEFKNGLFQGWGITDNYIGQFREGKYDGFGIYQEFQSSNKDIVTFYYEGYFSNGRYSGHGLEIKNCKIPTLKIDHIHKNGGITEYIEESIENGNSIAKKYEAKEVYIGQFAHGYRNGVGRLFKDNRQYSGTFMAGDTKVKGTVIDPAEEQQRKKRAKIEKISLNKSCIEC